MTTSENKYDFRKIYSHPLGGTRYFFISEGKKPIVKIVEYDYVDLNDGRVTYNLAFGTYNRAIANFEDAEISGNDDHYRVFNTVLSTIPHFLENYPGARVIVKGSDSADTYPDICRLNCKKKCIPPSCKNAHRRINIYKNFLNKNFEQLSQEYLFWGSMEIDGNQLFIEEYKTINNYGSVLFIKK
jgi:hypothetical protein